MASSDDDQVSGGSGTAPREADSEPTAERPAQLPEEGPRNVVPPPPLPNHPSGTELDPPVQSPSDIPDRPSLFDELRITRTTMHDVGKAAQRLSLLAPGLAESRRTVRQLVLSAVFGLLLTLAVALVFAEGNLRVLLGVLAGTRIAALGVFITLRVVAKLGERFGARSLPGSPWLWLGAVVLLALGGTFTVSLSLWEVTKLPKLAPPRRAASAVKPQPPPEPVDTVRADARMKRGVHVRIPRGVLYAPPEFQSADGQFDLMIHFHGNVELVEQSFAAAKLNALVAIINVGDGSSVYTKEMHSPYAFDRLLTAIEGRAKRRLHLADPQIRRVALSAWSAGFASVNEVLGSRSRFDRIDAVLLMDSPHAKYAPGSATDVYGPSIEPYVAFARRAMAGQKLMFITHSEIPTEGYPSTTEATDALLAALSLERQAAPAEQASPPPVELPVALRAFPSGERNWLQVVNQVKERDFTLYGCTGNGKGDHIAHLAQMSVTVLPALRDRWQ